ncbi:SanA/YdcF family protein [Actinomadura rupiterrae]|uniref:SanA/YdcF family protein n=1 Tax=Actinomadura rupiterrae TaxID=559627 RepID=UPI0020A59384|nr:ElyC/SanA/YdcF family protein [Actinomadura rupiterrae]MCP2337688.1 vancomycin permeability regulator SanA [Actinomadura rupiterrae]
MGTRAVRAAGTALVKARAKLRHRAGPLAVLAGLGVFAALLPTGWAYADTARYRHTPESVPETPVALVLGAGIANGEPSPLLARRLDLAAELYRRGKVKVLLVSGDNRTKQYDEPTTMRDYLIRAGIPADRIVRDFAGLDTWDSCVRAKQIFGVTRATVVTQRFHLPRAVALCRAAGIDAYGVGDQSMGGGRTDATINGYLREPLAMLKAVGSVTIKPGPKIGGAPEPGVHTALAVPEPRH